MSSFTMTLAKEDFKFSCAHFTLFGAEKAELLHGHNYQVSLELQGATLDYEGFLLGLAEAKKVVRALCAFLDERTLIPARSPHLQIQDHGTQVVVSYRDRLYALPKSDVLLVPIVNTTIECFSCLLWCELANVLRELPETEQIEDLTVGVSETAGQRCSFHASLDDFEALASVAGSLGEWRPQ